MSYSTEDSYRKVLEVDQQVRDGLLIIALMAPFTYSEVCFWLETQLAKLDVLDTAGQEEFSALRGTVTSSCCRLQRHRI